MGRHYYMLSGRGVVSRAQPVRAIRKKIDGGSLRAAQYLRMSTEQQKYSTQNQSEANQAYAALRGIAIVRTYADEGKSGLTVDRRNGLKRLIADVQSGHTDFEAVLVYDVSRWGRFRDPDEAAYYEYICKQAGIKVHYCAEEFGNDGSLFGAIAKNIKRSMAGEYSRELSVKVFAGQDRLVKLGFSQGAAPGYALRRMLVGENGAPKIPACARST
jgi:DNA invertase Pin-like site-specific DNA recombinase